MMMLLNYIVRCVIFALFLKVVSVISVEVKQGPNLFDLNEPASPGDSYSSKQRPFGGEEGLTRRRSSSEESVGDRNLERKRKHNTLNTVSSGIKKTKTSTDKINITSKPLDRSSASASDQEQKTEQKTKLLEEVGKTTCRIHRPGCDHWGRMDRSQRRNEGSRWRRYVDRVKSGREGQVGKVEYKTSEYDRQRKAKWAKANIKRMNDDEKRHYLNKKAFSMRKSRAKKRLLRQVGGLNLPKHR